MQTAVLALSLLLAACACSAATSTKKTPVPYTSFQTPTEYRADNDIRTDAVIVYSDDKARIRSWLDKGYVVQTMYGFRTGDSYIKDHGDEGQTDSTGTILTCGPGSYYMVPTESRIKAAVDYFTNAIAAGSMAVIPEEPEFFAAAGYSASFKKAWLDHYKEPWQDPTSSIAARYKSERLKAQMEYRMVKAIVDAAAKQNPAVRRMVACHSPVSYYSWGIVYPHYQCLMIPNIQEIVGQVWTGTARSGCKYAGVNDERTFENGFLEYSSLANLVRGTDRRMWFLMDPLEDNLDRSMEDYHTNYEKTLVASLMFPEVDAYEVMPWPTRIYGRVPDEFATEIGSIINALQDMHNHKTFAFDTGTRGIATLVADSMGWQRGAPHKSDYDGFYGITLPLVYKGIPVQVAQLEHAPVKGYLDPYKVLFLSYDYMKPMNPAYNQAIADWVKRGGVLVSFGGTDAYNELPEWWTQRGFSSPQADLYSRLGIDGKPRSVSGLAHVFTEIARETKQLRNLENRQVYSFDLKPYAAKSSAVYVRFRDAFPDDGWGSSLLSARLTIDGESTQFAPGSPAEKRYLIEDGGSGLNKGAARFADGDAYWIYRFDVGRGSAPVLELDMGNQFVVEIATRPIEGGWRLARSASNSLTRRMSLVPVPSRYPLTFYSAVGGEFYHVRDEIGSVVFEQAVGKGALIHVGVSPAYFASSAEAADMLRSIAAYACGKAGIAYKEQDRMGIRRGKYVAVRTFGGSKELKGSYVNVLDPKLGVVDDPVIGPERCALYYNVSENLSGSPRLLYSASKVEQRIEGSNSTSLKLSGAIKTKGAARIYTGGKSVESVTPAGVAVEEAGRTILLSYDNSPESVTIDIKWR